jgi:hypothetical protein
MRVRRGHEDLAAAKSAWGEIKVETKVDEGNTDNFGNGDGSKYIIYVPI